jgi:hypothetical protein
VVRFKWWVEGDAITTGTGALDRPRLQRWREPPKPPIQYLNNIVQPAGHKQKGPE